jgi:hypothetical protein
MVSTHFTNVHEPTTIEMKNLQLYSMIAADYAFQLLGNAVLSEKAKQMNEALYASALSQPLREPGFASQGL